MSMLIPGQNQLAEPAIIKVDEFEPLLAEFKAFVIDYVATRQGAGLLLRFAGTWKNRQQSFEVVT